MSIEEAIPFRYACGKVARTIRNKLNGDALEFKLTEFLARVECDEVVTTDDARVTVRTMVELDALSKRCRDYAERLDREVAKLPEHLREVYRQELEKGRR